MRLPLSLFAASWLRALWRRSKTCIERATVTNVALSQCASHLVTPSLTRSPRRRLHLRSSDSPSTPKGFHPSRPPPPTPTPTFILSSPFCTRQRSTPPSIHSLDHSLLRLPWPSNLVPLTKYARPPLSSSAPSSAPAKALSPPAIAEMSRSRAPSSFSLVSLASHLVPPSLPPTSSSHCAHSNMLHTYRRNIHDWYYDLPHSEQIHCRWSVFSLPTSLTLAQCFRYQPGRKEILMFFYLYAIIELLAIFLDSGIIPTANVSYPVRILSPNTLHSPSPTAHTRSGSQQYTQAS